MPPLDTKKTVLTLQKKKRVGERISAVTAYDYPTANVASAAGIDMILVGDSLGMVLQGQPNTLKTTMDDMVYHTRLVMSAQPQSLVVADMPFGSYHISVQQAVTNAIRFVQEGGAQAVKLEGGEKRSDVIRAILDTEIPVLGHVGLTPQSVHALGGFKTQGKMKEAAEKILEEALELERLGVFAIVLEAIPQQLGKRISQRLDIPTIGIGAGKYCDGQILVFHDLVGFSDHYLPKFVRKYADVYGTVHDALSRYIADIKSGDFPGEAESFLLKKKSGSGDDG
jgi:3-methyl-2-oxobutanoate hydroxymethyltransferase